MRCEGCFSSAQSPKKRTTTEPSSTPQSTEVIVMCAKKTATLQLSICAPKTTFNINANTAIAVPSFSRLSPDMSMVSRGLTPSVLNNATTATGSVADRVAPNTNALGQPQPYGRTYTTKVAV